MEAARRATVLEHRAWRAAILAVDSILTGCWDRQPKKGRQDSIGGEGRKKKKVIWWCDDKKQTRAGTYLDSHSFSALCPSEESRDAPSRRWSEPFLVDPFSARTRRSGVGGLIALK